MLLPRPRLLVEYPRADRGKAQDRIVRVEERAVAGVAHDLPRVAHEGCDLILPGGIVDQVAHLVGVVVEVVELVEVETVPDELPRAVPDDSLRQPVAAAVVLGEPAGVAGGVALVGEHRAERSRVRRADGWQPGQLQQGRRQVVQADPRLAHNSLADAGA